MFEMFVPKHLGHLEPNEFTLYGFTYPTIAHWIVIQMSAKNGGDFRKFFDMSVDELPEIKRFNHGMLEEGLDAMLPDIKRAYTYYDDMHPILGIGTTKMRLKFGEDVKGRNMYAVAIRKVLNRRKSFK